MKNHTTTATTTIDGFVCILNLDYDMVTIDISKMFRGAEYTGSILSASDLGRLDNDDYTDSVSISSATIGRIEQWEDSLVGRWD